MNKANEIFTQRNLLENNNIKMISGLQTANASEIDNEVEDFNRTGEVSSPY